MISHTGMGNGKLYAGMIYNQIKVEMGEEVSIIRITDVVLDNQERNWQSNDQCWFDVVQKLPLPWNWEIKGFGQEPTRRWPRSSFGRKLLFIESVPYVVSMTQTKTCERFARCIKKNRTWQQQFLNIFWFVPVVRRQRWWPSRELDEERS